MPEDLRAGAAASKAAQRQAADISPPRRGGIVALTVDSTARAYDIQAMAFRGFSPTPATEGTYLFVTLQADGGDVFYQFADVSAADLSASAAVAAGSPLVFGDTFAAKLSNGDRHEVRIARELDRFLIVKTSSGAATLRLWASSYLQGF